MTIQGLHKLLTPLKKKKYKLSKYKGKTIGIDGMSWLIGGCRGDAYYHRDEKK